MWASHHCRSHLSGMKKRNGIPIVIVQRDKASRRTRSGIVRNKRPWRKFAFGMGCFAGWAAFSRSKPSMCDYSIRHVASRPAKVRDKLVTTAFGARTNRGFASVDDPNVAVCLLPGTELAFGQAPQNDHFLGRFFRSLRSR